MDGPEYAFAAPLLRHADGMRQHYLPLPAEVADALAAAGVRRVVGTLNGHPVSRGVQGRKDGERFLLLGQDLLREIGVTYGETVFAVLRPDPEPDRVELPQEFAAALAADPEAAARFHAMTPGRQRSLAYYAGSAKRPETRQARALELAHKLRTHTLYGDLLARDGEP
jgi:hypothetical protein